MAGQFSFRLTSEGGAQVIADLKAIAPASSEAERALRALTAASPQLASVADGVQAKIVQLAARLRELPAAAQQAASSVQQIQPIQATIAQSTGMAQAAGAGAGVAAFSARTADIEAYGAELDRLRAKFNPLFAASKQYEATLAEISAAQRAGAISTKEAEAAQERATAAFAAANQPLNGALNQTRALTVATKEHTAVTGQAAFATRQFGVQSIQLFSSIATGQPILTAFIQQGHQMVDVAVATGTGFGVVGRAITGALAALVSPLGLAITGVVALGAAAYVTFGRMGELEGQARKLSVSLEATGRSALVSVPALQSYIVQLQRAGATAEEATATVNNLARDPRISQQRLGQITTLLPDLAAALGGTQGQAAEALKSIADANADAVRKLNDQLGFLTPAHEAAAAAAAKMGDSEKALNIVLPDLAERVKGLHERSLTPAAAATQALSNAWDSLVTRIANSGPAIATVNALANAMARLAAPSAVVSQLDKIDAAIAKTQADLAAIDPAERAIRGDMLAATLARLQRQREEIAAATAEPEFGRVPGTTPGTTAGAGTAPGAGTAISIVPPRAPGNDLAAAEARRISQLAADRAAASDFGNRARLVGERDQFRDRLKAIGPRSADNASDFDNLTEAIKANDKAIADIDKRLTEHRTGLQKQQDTLRAQITAQTELNAAYAKGVQATDQILAKQDAEKKAISDGLTPGTAKYAAAVSDLTAKFLALKKAQEQGEIIKQTTANADTLTVLQAETDAIGMNDAARQQMLAHLQAELELKNKLGTTEGDVAQKYLASVDAIAAQRTELTRLQNGMTALSSAGTQAFDTLGNSITDAFVQGGDSAVKFSNVVQGAFAALAKEITKLGLLNPLLNALFGGNNPTLNDAIDAAKKGGGGLFGQAIRGLFGSSSPSASSFGFSSTSSLVAASSVQSVGAGGALFGSGGIFFANGGIMTSLGPMPLNRYAGGGIATTPQVAVFGEGTRPEAYVPLPDGRTIPVSMQNGIGTTTVINQGDVHVHVASSNATQVQIAAAAQAAVEAANAKLIREVNRGGPLAKTMGRRRR